MIEVKKVKKKFGHIPALNGINFSLEKGEFLTIFGPNGAGKTTLLRCLSTLLIPTSGYISIDGIDISGENTNPVRKKIGMVSHYSFLYDNLTAYENLIFYSKMYDVKNSINRVKEELERVGLYSRKDDLVRTFSRGMQQRLSIARAILHDPAIVFLDEPYTGLDQHAACMFSQVLEHLKKNMRTIIMITHNLVEGLSICNKVAVQVRGRFVTLEKIDKFDKKDFSKVYSDLVENN